MDAERQAARAPQELGDTADPLGRATGRRDLGAGVKDLLAAIGAYTLITFVVLGLVLRYSRRAVRRHQASSDPWQRLLDRRRPVSLNLDWN